MTTQRPASSEGPASAPAGGVSPEELSRLHGLVVQTLPAYLEDLASLVNIDCGSYTKAGVDRVGRWTARFLERLGATVVVHPNAELGDTVVGTIAGTPGGPRLLLIGHMDTVFPAGTVAERPYRVEHGRAFGPGVTDMKSGLLAGLYGLMALLALGESGPLKRAGRGLPFERVVFIANPDEEIGSPVSGPLIRQVARDADACFVLECARANGDIVSARKGTVDLRVTIEGRAAHAGVEPEKGRSAILEAAHQVIALHALTGRWPGVTCNVGVIEGGIRPNVVAERAVLQVDLRAPARCDLEAAEAEIRALAGHPTDHDVTVTVAEMNRHWPMERLARSVTLIDHAQALAGRLGFEVRDAATGGASDANTTAGLGVPTLDGLGPIGGNDHAPTEYLELDSIVPRTTLLAALMLAVGRDQEVGAWRASGPASSGPSSSGTAFATAPAES
jgi:glutamate carboxypeptidase